MGIADGLFSRRIDLIISIIADQHINLLALLPELLQKGQHPQEGGLVQPIIGINHLQVVTTGRLNSRHDRSPVPPVGLVERPDQSRVGGRVLVNHGPSLIGGAVINQNYFQALLNRQQRGQAPCQVRLGVVTRDNN